MATELLQQQGTDTAPDAHKSTIGTAVPRIDGPVKTTGVAQYSSDHNLPGMVYAIPVQSTIASGKIASIDTTQAAAMRGVLKVYTRENFPKVYRSNPADNQAVIDERRPPLEDDTIYYAGQYVAVVIAKTMDQARHAAAAVRVQYTPAKANVSRDLADGFGAKLKEESKRGDVDATFAKAAIRVDETYITPVEVHNPIELHASVAHWDGQKYLLYETTQSVVNHQIVMAQMLGVPKENVQVIMRYLGSGFGGKLWPWSHAFMAAVASRDLNLPVKLVVDRRMMFTSVGHRPQTVQQVKLSATPDGKLTSLEHTYTSDSSMLDDVAENCGEATPYLYSTPNLRVRSSVVDRNVGTPTSMRGPGAVPGLYAVESAMDELAIKLKMDPVQLRMINEPAMDESNGKPFSSRHLTDCLRIGAERFGWAKRNPEVGSMRKGDITLGWGVSACSWMSMRMACKATLRLNDDGSATILCATQDIGTGTYTIFAQAVHAKTAVPLDRIQVQLGNTAHPEGPMSGGSWTTGSVLPAIDKATDAAITAILGLATKGINAPFEKVDPKELAFTNGMVHRKTEAPSAGVPFAQVLKRTNLRAVSGEGNSEASFADKEWRDHSNHSYGAQFVEVEWDAGIARLRVSRVVSVIDVGQIINLKTARNQVEGAIVMGIGMGMFEEAEYDQRTGLVLNSNLADYIVSTSADCPEIDVTFTDFPDKVANSFGARGCGEIGLAGVAPAITAAVYHATGIRVRKLPVKIEDLLPAPIQMHTA